MTWRWTDWLLITVVSIAVLLSGIPVSLLMAPYLTEAGEVVALFGTPFFIGSLIWSIG